MTQSRSKLAKWWTGLSILKKVLVVAVVIIFVLIALPVAYLIFGPARLPDAEYADLIAQIGNAESAELLVYYDERDLAEYKPFEERVVKRIKIGEEGIDEFQRIIRRRQFFQNTLGVWIACHVPRHGVHLRKQDGSTLEINICFECNNFSIGKFPDQHIYTMPPAWRWALKSYFLDRSIPLEPKSASAAR